MYDPERCPPLSVRRESDVDHDRGAPALEDLQREVHELKRANEILGKTSAYFAQAELDRRAK
jgi:transposase-like protein